jgi:hypothetical protein
MAAETNASAATVGTADPSQTAALNLNLTGYDRLRVEFGGLTGGLNFNMVAEQGSNGNIAGACGLSLAPSGESHSDRVHRTG